MLYSPLHRAFSLIELLVVIGIILFLAKIALPRFTSYIRKARHAEVALILSSLYTAQQAYHIEHGTFTTNLKTLGWQPRGHKGDGKKPDHVYTYGFGGSSKKEGESVFTGSAKTSASKLGNCYAKTDSFIARAVVEYDGKDDLWKIDETGTITHENE